MLLTETSIPEDAALNTPHSHRDPRHEVLENYIVKEKKGKRVLSRILIASNGLAAVKAIRSMRRWEVLEVLQRAGAGGITVDRCLSFVAMGTPEDIEANAQFLQMVDSFVEVPGGKNVNNYANVELICKVALQEKCDAVWPGWGHASEKPELPESLEKLGIVFLGPQPRVMRLLGDKIYANIMAQTAEVPCIPWSGDGLIMTGPDVSKDKTQFSDLDTLFKAACCDSAEDAVKHADRIGYPVMLKASEGGGGKGIRKCSSAAEVRGNFASCKFEVVNSPIFIMKYSSGACHLEVQLLGDEHGNVCALSGRDCSTQRRFQKIFEEGPPTVADEDVFHQMQLAACRLAKQVGYRGAGTVEYLYDPKQKKAAFLELNPRLQVEHPVTECITGVNIPAAQLQIGMGVPLQEIPDIRRFFLREIEDFGSARTKVDFSRKVPMYAHCIAARITAENPEDGFLPCSGKIKKIDFAPTHESVWGYFSVATPGSVHEFADSQFGHVFSIGATREAARKALIISLGHLHVEGDIRTTVDVLPKLLRLNKFVDNQVDTSWLDGLIANKEIARLQAVPLQGLSNQHGIMDNPAYSDDGVMSVTDSADGVPLSSSNLVGPSRGAGLSAAGAGSGAAAVVAAATARSSSLNSLSQILGCEDFILYCAIGKALELSDESRESFRDTLAKGQMVNSFLPTYSFPEVTVVWDQVKYAFHITRIAENRFSVRCKDDNSECQVQIKSHQGAVFVRVVVGGTSRGHNTTSPATKIVCSSEAQGMRLRIGAMSGYEVFIPNATDPSELRSDVQGRLIRFLVNEGDNIEEGQVCCELEAMKMIVPVKARFAGVVEKLVGGTNAVVGAGDLLLKMALKGAGPSVTVAKYSEVSNGRKLFQSPPSSSASDAADNVSVLVQDAHPVLQGFPRYGKLRLPDSVEEGLQLLQEFLDVEKHFLSGNSNISNEQVLHQLLKSSTSEIDQIYKIFFAKSQLHSRLVVALEIVAKFDSKLLVVGRKLVSELADLPERYGELGLICTRLLRENARNYVNLNTVAAGKEWIEHHMMKASTNGTNPFQPEMANQRSAPELKTLMNLIHLLAPGSANFFGASVASNAEKNRLRSRALELVVCRTFRGYEALSVGPELLHDHLPATIGCDEEDDADEERPAFSAARSWKYRYPGVGNSFSGFGSFVPACSGVAVVVQSLKDLKRLIEPGFLHSLASGDMGGTTNDTTAAVPNTRSSFAPMSGAEYSLEMAQNVKPVLHDLWILFGADLEQSDVKQFIKTRQNTRSEEKASTEEIADFFLQHLNNRADGIAELVELHRVSFTWTGGGASESYQFLNRRSLGRSLPVRNGQNPNAAFAEDVMVRHLRPVLGHLLEITDTVRTNSPIQRIGPEISAHCMALLNKDHLEIRTVSYVSKNVAGGVFAAGAAAGVLGGFAYSMIDEGDFYLPVEEPLTLALDELARARMDKRVISGHPQKLPARIFINLMSRLAFSPTVVMRGYEASILSSLSGFVRQLLKYRVETVEFKLRLTSGENLRMVASSEAEYLQPKAYLEYLNPITGEVTRSVDLAHLVSGLMGSPMLLPEDGEYESKKQAQEAALSKKRTSAHQAGSTYVYDFPHLLKLALMARSSQATSNSRKSTNERAGVAEASPSSAAGGGSATSTTTPGSKSVFTVVELISEEEHARCLIGSKQSTSAPGGLKSSPSASDMAMLGGSSGSANELQSLLNRPIQFKGASELSTSADPNPNQPTTSTLREKLSQFALVPTSRQIAHNSIGMVSWIVFMRTQEFPEGRFIVLVANDITHKAGSFGVQEDTMFKQCGEFARKNGLPFVYIAANSGARVGMVDGLENAVRPWFTKNAVAPGSGVSSGKQVVSRGANLPAGFEYWYLDEASYEKHKSDVVVEEVQPDAANGITEKHYKITAIVGGNGIGVENLKGSAMIAGETSRAYSETFTLSYVTGRSVGIGAYVNRLGSRIIQQRHGPMILTGFSALNKLLGRQVYTSQEQLGGPQVMCPNGVTHLLVENDQEGCERILEWLSFVPKYQHGPLPILPCGFSSKIASLSSADDDELDNKEQMLFTKRGAGGAAAAPPTAAASDLSISPPTGRTKGGTSGDRFNQMGAAQLLSSSETVDRPVTFHPSSDSPYDPRHLLNGTPDNDFTGFLDENSFVEVLADWGKTVVVGRGRLGGIPLGVIAVETRAVSRYVPADPANLDSAVVEEAQAGQVWFPDSAYKTASAIRDFNREGLPLMIFANWRGFSGGTRDMFLEILKYGAQIVDALVAYENPVFVYLPPGSELRGGAWVVIDPSINPDLMEMYASPESRGGILEPAGAVDVKLRPPTLVKMMHRCDPVLAAGGAAASGEGDKLRSSAGSAAVTPTAPTSGVGAPGTVVGQKPSASRESSATTATTATAGQTPMSASTAPTTPTSTTAATSSSAAAGKRREELLLPLYQSMALHYADLHDRAPRMKKTGCVRDVVDWESSREFFYWRIKRRLLEVAMWRELMKMNSGSSGAETSAGAAGGQRKAAIESCNRAMRDAFGVDNLDGLQDEAACRLFEEKSVALGDKLRGITKDAAKTQIRKLLNGLSQAEKAELLAGMA